MKYSFIRHWIQFFLIFSLLLSVLAHSESLTDHYLFDGNGKDSVKSYHGVLTKKTATSEEPIFITEGLAPGMKGKIMQLGMTPRYRSGMILDSRVISRKKGSISLWFYDLYSLDDARCRYILVSEGGSGLIYLGVDGVGDQKKLLVKIGEAATARTNSFKIGDAEFNHVVISWDNDTGAAIIYLNGALVSEFSFSAPEKASDNGVRIGGFNLIDKDDYQVEHQFVGYLYDLRFYNDMIPENQIKDIAEVKPSVNK